MAQPARQRTFVRYWLPVLAYVGLIFVLSSQPGLKPPFKFEMSDKVAHICEYGGLGVLLARALTTMPRFRSTLVAGLVAVVIGSSIGATDELYQYTVPNRDSDVRDWMADTLGLSLAQLVYLWMKRP